MNQTAAISVSSVFGTILTILVILIIWHWLESGAGVTTGIRMSWQDVKVTVSCRSLDTAARFIGRSYEDHLSDKELFRIPRWKRLVCPIYASEAARTPQYRAAVSHRAMSNLSVADLEAIIQWAEAHQVDKISLTDVMELENFLNEKKSKSSTGSRK